MGSAQGSRTSRAETVTRGAEAPSRSRRGPHPATAAVPPRRHASPLMRTDLVQPHTSCTRGRMRRPYETLADVPRPTRGEKDRSLRNLWLGNCRHRIAGVDRSTHQALADRNTLTAGWPELAHFELDSPRNERSLACLERPPDNSAGCGRRRRVHDRDDPDLKKRHGTLDSLTAGNSSADPSRDSVARGAGIRSPRSAPPGRGEAQLKADSTSRAKLKVINW